MHGRNVERTLVNSSYPKRKLHFFFYLYIDTLETVSVVLMTVVIVVVLTIAEVVVAEVVVGLLTVFQVLY